MIAAFNFAHHINNTMHRRHFLKTTPALLGMAWEIRHFPAGRKKPLLSFSTLGCPQWSFEKIVQCAADNGYQGIEIRGIQDQLDLPKCPEFSTPERIAATRRLALDLQRHTAAALAVIKMIEDEDLRSNCKIVYGVRSNSEKNWISCR